MYSFVFLFICAAKEYRTDGSSSADSRLIEEVQCSQKAQGLFVFQLNILGRNFFMHFNFSQC